MWNAVYNARVRAIIPDRDPGPWELDVSRYALGDGAGGDAATAGLGSAPAAGPSAYGAPGLGSSTMGNGGQMLGPGSGL